VSNGETRPEAYWQLPAAGRGAVGWRIVSRDETACGVAGELTGRSMDARAAAALSLVKREALPVEVLDELHWRIMPAIAFNEPLAPDRGYLFWPATGYWRRPSHGGGGAGKLIEEMRQLKPGTAVTLDSML
jgi:hypothetical protein